MALVAATYPAGAGYLYYRHALPVRIMHWINVVALTILLMSGLQIFNAHPALYWGQSSYSGRPPLFEIRALQKSDGTVVGVTRVLGHEFDTTGLFGVSRERNGELGARQLDPLKTTLVQNERAMTTWVLRKV